MGLIGLASLSLGVCGVLLVGCGFAPGRSAARWGRAFHAEQHLDHLYSKEWFDQFRSVVQQEQLGRAGGTFILAGLVVQQFAGLGQRWMTLLAGIGVGAALGIVLALFLRHLVIRLCTARVASRVEILAGSDIRSHGYTKKQIKQLLDPWFKELVGREPCIVAEPRAAS